MANWKINDGSNMESTVEKVMKILDVSINFINTLILHRPDLHSVHACCVSEKHTEKDRKA